MNPVAAQRLRGMNMKPAPSIFPVIKFLIKISSLIDRFSDLTGRMVSWLTLFMVILVTVDVVLRYLFNISFVAVQELEWHIFALVFLLGGGYTLRHNAHVRVDVIYQRLGRKARAWINILGCLFFLFPGCFLMIQTSIPFMESSIALHEMSPDPGGLPYRYLLKAAIPLAFMFMALQGISLLIHSIMDVAGIAPETATQSRAAEDT
jgi:TRAP-type mannitol/chloroaromatic compound transport system permease small subunit